MTIENPNGERALLVDIETLRQSERKAKEARDYAEAVIESIPPFLVLDSDLRVQTANESFCEHFHVSRPQTENYQENGHKVIQCNIRDITERKARTT